MFEIGTSLREARRRQGLELDEVAAATSIRARYLDALEREQFSLLPDGFYRRSFLRGYADFLGLDGDLYVSEYELRYAAAPEEPDSETGRGGFALPRRTLAAGALAALLVVAGLAAWRLGGQGAPKAHRAPKAAPAVTLPAGAVPAHVSGLAPGPPAPLVLVLTAARGNCWLLVLLGSQSGRALYGSTLAQGQSVRFGLRRPLWIRVGAPQNLDATLAGRSVTALLPSAPAWLRVTRGSLETVG